LLSSRLAAKDTDATYEQSKRLLAGVDNVITAVIIARCAIAVSVEAGIFPKDNEVSNKPTDKL